MDAGTTVVLADPHAMVRDGLRLALEATGRMTVVGETGCRSAYFRAGTRRDCSVL